MLSREEVEEMVIERLKQYEARGSAVNNLNNPICFLMSQSDSLQFSYNFWPNFRNEAVNIRLGVVVSYTLAHIISIVWYKYKLVVIDRNW